MQVLAIVPARKGSARLPGKHRIPLLGVPMISWTLRAARAAARLDRIVLSTDDEALAPMAQAHGVELLERPAELATDTAALDDGFRHVVGALAARDGWRPDLVVALGGNLPVRKPGQIDEVIARLAADGEATAMCTAIEERIRPEWMKRLTDRERGAVEPFITGVVGYRKQDFPPLVRLDGAICAVRTDVLMDTPPSRVPHAWLGGQLRVLVQEHAMYGFEVDYPDEVALAAFYLRLAAEGERVLARLER